MVRTKTQSSKKASSLAPPGKVLLIEKNRASSTPLKTPVSSRPSLSAKLDSINKSLGRSQNKTLNKSADASHNSTVKNKSGAKKRKARPGVRAIQEIRKFQKSTSLLIPKLPFSRVVREILQNDPRSSDFRISSLALAALQEATEMAIVNLMEVANLCCLHAHRVTLAPSDIRLTRRAFGLANPIND